MKIGEKHNRWTCIGASSISCYARFRCDCGTERDVRTRNVKQGLSKSCGCLAKETQKAKTEEKYLGRRYSRLTVIELVRTDGQLTHFVCKCDCGNTCTVYFAHILYGRTRSCGCIRQEKGKKHKEFLADESQKAHNKYGYDGTRIDSFDQKLSVNSTTGVKGVSQMRNGRYRAYISVRRKQIHIGVFDTLEEAAQARKEAEERIFGEIKEDWENR